MRSDLTPLRYLVVTLIGLAIDLGSALLLVDAGVSRPAAGAVGLMAGAGFNFVLHRTWTFPSNYARPVATQLLSYVVALALTIAVRVAVLSALGAVFPFIDDPVALLLAAGVSFAFNFLLLKRLVFSQGIPQ